MANQREEILSCACDLYLEEGLEGFSMRRLAELVGVTAPALYRHYEGKEALLVDMVEEAYRRLARKLYQALEGSDPLDRFLRAGRAYVEFALEQPRMYEVLYAYPQFLGMVELPEETAAQACAIGQFWNDRVRECQDAGLLRAADTPDEIAVTLWGHAHGLLSLYLRGMLQRGETGDGAMDEDAFLALFGASSRRALRGLGTPAMVAALEMEDGAERGAERVMPPGAGPAEGAETALSGRA